MSSPCSAASLYVAEDGHARLVAGALLDLVGELVADPAQADVAEGVEALVLRDGAALARLVCQLVALADHDDRKVLAALVPAA